MKVPAPDRVIKHPELPARRLNALQTALIGAFWLLSFLIASLAIEGTALRLMAAAYCVLAAWITWHDLREYIIPDRATIALALTGCAGIVSQSTNVSAWEAISGGFVAVLTLMLVAEFFRRFRGKEGLGFGDVKLAGALGLWIGVASIPVFLLISSLSSLIALLVWHLIDKRARENKELPIAPFGPFLCFGGLCAWIGLHLESKWLENLIF